MALLLAVLLGTPVSAVASPLQASLGLETTIHDAFVVRRGARLGAGIETSPGITLTATGAIYPILGDLDETSLQRTLVDDFGITADLSRIAGHAGVGLRLGLLHHVASDGTHGGLDLEAGLGGVYTVDELFDEDTVALQVTRRQVHPSLDWVLAAEVGRAAIGLRLTYRALVFLEVIERETVEFKQQSLAGLEVVWRPGSR